MKHLFAPFYPRVHYRADCGDQTALPQYYNMSLRYVHQHLSLYTDSVLALILRLLILRLWWWVALCLDRSGERPPHPILRDVPICRPLALSKSRISSQPYATGEQKVRTLAFKENSISRAGSSPWFPWPQPSQNSMALAQCSFGGIIPLIMARAGSWDNRTNFVGLGG